MIIRCKRRNFFVKDDISKMKMMLEFCKHFLNKMISFHIYSYLYRHDEISVWERKDDVIIISERILMNSIVCFESVYENISMKKQQAFLWECMLKSTLKHQNVWETDVSVLYSKIIFLMKMIMFNLSYHQQSKDLTETTVHWNLYINKIKTLSSISEKSQVKM